MSDCSECKWVNNYKTCQDGSREYAAYDHKRTHSMVAAAHDEDCPECFAPTGFHYSYCAKVQ